MNIRSNWLLVAIAATALMQPGLARAQEPPQAADPFSEPPTTSPAAGGVPHGQDPALSSSPFQIKRPPSAVSGSRSMYFYNNKGSNPTHPIRVAAEAVRDAKTDDDKSAAQKNLSGLLAKFYDDDMKQREQELKQIENRLEKLRELLERRRTKKQEIIELQTKVALNEAEGLGFYDAERPKKYSDLQRVDDLFSSPVPVGPPLTPAVAAPPKPPKTPTPPRDSR